MAVKLRTWSQSEWRRPGRLHHYAEGDFHDLSGLYPDYTRRKVKRGPAWSAHVPWPEEVGVFEGFVDANVLVLDPGNNIFAFYGKLTNGHLASVHWSRTNKAVADKYGVGPPCVHGLAQACGQVAAVHASGREVEARGRERQVVGPEVAPFPRPLAVGPEQTDLVPHLLNAGDRMVQVHVRPAVRRP